MLKWSLAGVSSVCVTRQLAGGSEGLSTRKSVQSTGVKSRPRQSERTGEPRQEKVGFAARGHAAPGPEEVFVVACDFGANTARG